MALPVVPGCTDSDQVAKCNLHTLIPPRVFLGEINVVFDA